MKQIIFTLLLILPLVGLAAQPQFTDVTLSSGERLEVSIYEITFADFDSFCRSARKEAPDDEGWERKNRPVVDVSWREAVDYCNWLSRKHSLETAYAIQDGEVTWKNDSGGYRLPTESEWIALAAGGLKEPSYAGDLPLEDLAWFEENRLYSVVHPVGTKEPNTVGLYDMCGNAAEWIWDSPDKGYRLVKGGSYTSRREFCRLESSVFREEDYKIFNLGFRIVRNLE